MAPKLHPLLAAGLLAAGCASEPAQMDPPGPPAGEPAPPLTVPGDPGQTGGAPGDQGEPGEPDAGSVADEPAAGGEPGAPVPPARDPVSALLTTSYRGRFGDEESDHDVMETASITAGDPGLDRFTFHALASASLDLDGTDPDSSFFQLSDTYDHDLTGQLYHAYVDVHRVKGFDVLRAGRQVLYETPDTVYVDGVRVETAAHGDLAWRLGGYGGVQVLPYESSRDGHYVIGAFAEALPFEPLRLRADWLRADDDEGGDDADDVLAIKGVYTPDLRLTLEASHSRFVRDPRDWRMAGRWFDAETDLSLEARYYELLTPLRDLAVPLDPFYETLFDSFPCREAGLSLGKGLGEDWFLQAGADLRRVTDDEDIGAFNRDFDRWYATATAEDLLPKEIALSVTGEVWDGSGDRYETWGLGVEKQVGEDWRVDAGSFYSLYKFDVFLDEEREDVRTYYAGLRHQATESLALRARYEYEHNDLDDFQTLRLGLTWEL